MRKELRRLLPQGSGDFDEFDDIDAPFPDLDLRDEGLRPPEPARELLLTEAGALSGGNECRTEGTVRTGSKRLQRRAPQGWSAYI